MVPVWLLVMDEGSILFILLITSGIIGLANGLNNSGKLLLVKEYSLNISSKSFNESMTESKGFKIPKLSAISWKEFIVLLVILIGLNIFSFNVS